LPRRRHGAGEPRDLAGAIADAAALVCGKILPFDKTLAAGDRQCHGSAAKA
jgi:hypothetical protein